jgi:hypothetical protein
LVTAVGGTTVRLSEIFPAPSDKKDWDGDGQASAEDEWIEVYNYGTSVVVFDDQWLIDDAEGGSKPYALPAGKEIKPDQCLIFYRAQTGVVLNNAADTVRLFHADTLLDSYTYEGVKADESLQFDGSVWHKSNAPTPGECLQTTALPTPSFASTGGDIEEVIWKIFIALLAVFW